MPNNSLTCPGESRYQINLCCRPWAATSVLGVSFVEVAGRPATHADEPLSGFNDRKVEEGIPMHSSLLPVYAPS